ncbi:hypothetical protein CNR22_03970 [Sphingobacteriaceae bacterium]|nr:hypothetical protein CNR22_03970 [Sphingobacteriaceae bacterium]
MLNFDHKARVFKEEALQSQLNNEGFVVLDFLNEAEVQRLYTLYIDLHPQGVNGFYTSTFSKDTAYRKSVDTEIRKEMQRGLDIVFCDYRVHCGSFIVKGTDEKSKLNLHQDMTLVNESVYTGINIWIPLVDLSETNGAIAVLPRSHRLFKTYRGASIPDIYDGIESSVYKIMRPCYLKAGQAIIFDQSIIHFSPANHSLEPRPVINTFITHKDAGIEICYWDKASGKNEIELFEQAPDFMVNFQNFGHDIYSRPSIGQSKGVVSYNFPKITPALLKQEYNLTEPEPLPEKPLSSSVFSKLFKKIFTRT